MQAPVVDPLLASHQRIDVTPVETTESVWKPLYRVGGLAALLGAANIPIAVFVFVVWPPPNFQPTSQAVIDWCTFIQNNKLLGLLDLDLLLMAGQVLTVLVFLAFYAALRRASQSFMAIALTFGLLGAAIYVPAHPGFSLLSLSDQYAAATTDAQRSALVAAGQSLLATYQGTAFDVSYILWAVATLIIAIVMLRSTTFIKTTAYVGIVMGITMLVPATAGTVGLVLSLVSLLPTVIWDILVARRLFQLGHATPTAQVSPAVVF